jgi:hypothetical protein
MEKINSDISKLLQDEEKKERIFKKILEDVKDHLETKFVNFKKDNNIKNIVSGLISSIYQTKKEEAVNKYIEISSDKTNKKITTMVGF